MNRKFALLLDERRITNPAELGFVDDEVGVEYLEVKTDTIYSEISVSKEML
jgi:hypothetical protein